MQDSSDADRRPVEIRAVDVVLTGSEDLLRDLGSAALHAGVLPGRLHLVHSDGLPVDPVCGDAMLAVVAVRRRGDDPAFHRAFEAVQRIRPLLSDRAVCVVITVGEVTRLAPRLERRVAAEVLHQVDAAGASRIRRTWRPLRMRIGLAALRAAGVRVFRISI